MIFGWRQECVPMGCPTSSGTRSGWDFTPANRSTASRRGCCCLRITCGVTWGRPVASGRHRWVSRRGSCPLLNVDELSRGLVLGESFGVIADRLGRAHSTVSRQVARNAAGSPTERRPPTAGAEDQSPRSGPPRRDCVLRSRKIWTWTGHRSRSASACPWTSQQITRCGSA